MQMTEWFIQEGEDLEARRTTEVEQYDVHEEKIGELSDPDYTMVTVFEEGELVAGATYEGDGRGLVEATDSFQEDDFDYQTPVSLLDPKLRADGGGNDDEFGNDELDYLI